MTENRTSQAIRTWLETINQKHPSVKKVIVLLNEAVAVGQKYKRMEEALKAASRDPMLGESFNVVNEALSYDPLSP